MEVEEVKAMLLAGRSYKDISLELKSLHPHQRGLSERSVRRFVSNNDLKHVCETEKQVLVMDSIKEVGNMYGRKMLKGYLASKGASVSERSLRRYVPYLTPRWHTARQQASNEKSNPPLYIARYFGHKLHIDQNEKLVHYGVTYVLARDGYSGKIVGDAVMAIKNNVIIYEDVYRTCLSRYGLWDEVRVDHGKEFYLLLYMQEKLRNEGRGDPDVSPYVQTSSTSNHVIERIWVELNQRVTYPIKRVVTVMDDRQLINMDDNVHKYCVSLVLRKVCMVGLQRFISAWNSHPIPRKGVPNTLQTQNNHTTQISPSVVPTPDNAVLAYREQGGNISDPRDFGYDPLDAIYVPQRDQEWATRCGMSPEDIYTQLMCKNPEPLQHAILHFIDITRNLSE